MPRPILLVVLDGLGDRPLKELGGKTPLQAAATPQLDRFAAEGVNGLVDPIAPGVCPGSDTAHLALLGYEPRHVYTGRGPFEAAGVGIDVRPGDVAFRCNFATVDDNGHVADRRAGRIREGTADLAAALDGREIDGVRVLFREGTEHRAALVLRGDGLSAAVSDTDPHREGAPIRHADPLADDAGRTAAILNRFLEEARPILADHPVNRDRRARGLPPANALVTRGGGVFPHLPSLREKHALEGAVVAGVALIKGICRALGMAVMDVPGATGGLDTDLEAKAEAAMGALREKDFVLLNVKAPDICGHDGKVREKVRVVEGIDDMVGRLQSGLGDDVVIALTADHSTPCVLRAHSGDPVPTSLHGEGVRRDDVAVFDEIAAARGGLGRLRGTDLLPVLLDLAGRSTKYGA